MVLSIMFLFVWQGELIKVSHGAEIYVEQVGSGEPLLFLPGLGTTHDTWSQLAEVMKDDYRLVLFDLRGSGSSSMSEAVYSLAGLASDALEVMTSLGHEKFHLVGLSLGSFVAQNVAVMAPERLSSLTLIGSTMGGPQHVAPSNEVISFFMTMGSMPPDQRVALGLKLALHPDWAAANETIVARYAEYSLQNPQDPVTLSKQIMIGTMFDFSQQAGTIHTPTLIIHGAQDQVVPVDNARKLAALIPESKLVVLEGSGHASHIDAAKRVADAINSFLESSD